MQMETWTFLTNHAHVLLCIWADPEIRLRDVADKVGITERATQRIVADLIEGGYLTSRKIGRRNRYEVHANLPFRHPIENHSNVSVLLELLNAPANHNADAGWKRSAAKNVAKRREIVSAAAKSR